LFCQNYIDAKLVCQTVEVAHAIPFCINLGCIELL
jgi:hypothetical protein